MLIHEERDSHVMQTFWVTCPLKIAFFLEKRIAKNGRSFDQNW